MLNQITRHFFWKPAGLLPSLASLDASHGLVAKYDVTVPVSGQNGPPPLTIAELAGGKIIGDLRMVATAGDLVVGELQSLFGSSDPPNHYLLKRRRFRLLKYRRGTALLLGAANSDNYFHWLLDSVPRWKMLQTAKHWDYDYVLLHSQPVPFQDEVLDLLEIPVSKRLRCSKNFVHQFERLVVPSMPFILEEIPPWVCVWVRSLFPGQADGPDKIYLRRGPGRRRLVNEAELETELQKRGFVSVQPDRLSVAEQAKILSSARSVVAPHGAALTNMVFAPTGALLLDLFHPGHKNRCLINLAGSCGHRYLSLDGRSTNQAGDRQLEYSVDIPAALKMLETASLPPR
jgi:hypothetical protein